jgi:mRNA-degrading endonuclease RelE of RelBE toxin-antitoxin system
VTHFASQEFWRLYEQLPENIRRLADKNFEILKADPRHPSLRLKKVGRYWSARIGDNYRTLAVESSDGLIWFWIGTHADYDRLIG